MRSLRIALVTMGLLGGSVLPPPNSHVHDADVHAATCTPKKNGPCSACKNCKYCANCAKHRGSCSVCAR
jgi:hypothetical protein